MKSYYIVGRKEADTDETQSRIKQHSKYYSQERNRYSILGTGKESGIDSSGDSQSM